MATRLKYVDPHRPPSRLARLYAAVANTRLGRFPSVHLVWRVDPYLMRATRGRVGMGLVLPTALLETRARGRAPYGETWSSLPRLRAGHDRRLKARLRAPPGVVSQPPRRPGRRLRGLSMRATAITDESERRRLWTLADRVFAPYAAYRREAAESNRVIPIVELTAR